MDSARRAAARADADDIYAMPNPSPDAHMTIDELRRELLHEGSRQQFILAELAKRRELEDEFRARFRQTTMPYRGTSPLQHGGSPLPFARASMSRRPVKDRIEEWYQPPWCRTIEADAPIVGAQLHKNAPSGVKRKRTAETQSLVCSICNVICYNETDLEQHLRGKKHQKKIEALKGEGKGTEEKHEKEALQLRDKNQKPVSRWMCNICNTNCSSQAHLNCHL